MPEQSFVSPLSESASQSHPRGRGISDGADGKNGAGARLFCGRRSLLRREKAGAMERKRKGFKKDPAAAPAESAPAPHGRGGGVGNERSPSPLGAGLAEHQASRVNEGKEPACRGRNAPQRPRKEGGSLRGESDQAGRRLEPKEKQPGAAQKVQPGAPKAGAADAACRKGEKTGEGRKAPRKGKGVAPQAGDSGEVALGASQAQRDEPDPVRADAAAQKKRACQKPRGAPEEASDQKPVRSLREVLKTITLRQEAVSRASERVNKVMDLLITAIKKDPRFSSIEKRGTGSYYEHLKISKPDEFDIMLALPKLRLDLESCDSAGAFYFVKLKRNPGKAGLNNFLNDEEQLSAFKMLSELRNIIKKEVKKIEEENVTVMKKKAGCPAVTLLIGEPPSAISVDIILALEGGRHNQCNSTKEGLNIERWLGTKVKRKFCNKPLCLVPKNFKDGQCLIDCWRLSFSHIEKDIILCHGSEKTCCESEGKKCCRKDCLKLLKYLLELLKTKHENRNQFDKFFSYHAKTAFFQACVEWPKDSEWLETKLDDCFEKFLDFFLDCLKNAELRHFFIPEFNFFSTDRIDTAKCRALARVIESERNNRFPIFFS
ncbi:hypothetical protein lerEdw1_001291 [Lerista edwardsae]|nr:hypothetical protein lerEdw1_001291 [Lerista edwardsae]